MADQAEKMDKLRAKNKKTPEESERDLHHELEWEAYAHLIDEINNATSDVIDHDNLKYDEDALDAELDLLKNINSAD